MKKELTCNQVTALLNFYIEGVLTQNLTKSVEIHLDKCPSCQKKFDELKKVLDECKHSTSTTTPNPVQPEIFKKLSAYMDNELNTNDNLKVKKIAISNPSARKELETLYKFKKLLHSSYEKTKNEGRFDYSGKILTEIKTGNEYSTTYFYKLATLFLILVAMIIGGFIYLYF
jgi:hypothetical protein